MQTVKMSNLEFDVTVDGAVYQPQSVPSQVLDEVRLAAASLFLGEVRTLSKAQREYWSAIRNVTPEARRFGR